MSTLRNRNSAVEKDSASNRKSTTNKDKNGKVNGKSEIKNGDTVNKNGKLNGKSEIKNGDTVSKNGKLDKSKGAVAEELLIGSYWLNRIVFIRYLSFIYFVAFLVALHQNKQLIGKHGLLPSDTFLNMIKSHFGRSQQFKAFMNIPTLLIFVDNTDDIDWWLDCIAILGLFLSALVFIKGAANAVIMFQLWLLYHSLVNVGQTWYSFGWESQLLESGFIAIFFVPLFEIKQLPANRKPSWVVIWGNRWLIFRIMIGAGLIKIRGDQCWRDLTCMNYHYQTQPVPNPVSYYLHQSPVFIHKFETLSNHFVELVAPILLVMPRKLRIFGGSIQVFFQVVLIISGNLSFLNWLTILPSIACFDDSSLSFMFSHDMLTKARKLQADSKAKTNSLRSVVYTWLDYLLLGVIGILSIPVIQNLFSSQQAMNTSFDSFRIVNTYGAFGSITKTRTEVIIQGTRNSTIIPDEAGGLWEEYEFHCKPGDIKRRPCVISPYHYRLDWLMWFSAFQNYQQNPWLIHLAAKLLVNDNNATSLISYNPFVGGKPPQFIRGQHYKYEYTKIGSGSSDWWKRKLIGSYFPVVDLKTLQSFLKHHHWKLSRNT